MNHGSIHNETFDVSNFFYLCDETTDLSKGLARIGFLKLAIFCVTFQTMCQLSNEGISHSLISIFDKLNLCKSKWFLKTTDEPKMF